MTKPIDNQRFKDDIKKAYDDVADTYLSWTEPSHETRLFYLDAMLRSLDAANETHNLSILELGCGAGIPCTQLLASHKNISVTANDISDAQIALAKERLPQSVHLIPGDMMELEFDQEKFDAVLAMYSIFHLPRDEQTVILRRIFDWLKPGGHLLSNFPESEFESASNNSWLGGTKGAMHWSGWGRDETRRLLENIGFVVEIDEVAVNLEVDNGISRNVPFQWILAKKSA
jgi:ubiquinone/menaquinone biosynthesis C-methylase UbiE